MMERRDPKARARRQERVAKVVWGSLFLVMGVLFTLHDMGKIKLVKEPSREFSPEFSPENAVDGDDKTRWSSAFRDPQWLTVDLGAPVPLGRIRINWESAFARDYELQVSSDGIGWTTARKVKGAQGGIDEQEVAATARYVRMLGTKRSTPYGYSFWELQVFDSAGNLVSEGKPAQASSMEDQDQGPFALWMQFWPLLLVASGLPLFLVPRDDASQVVGVVLTALGTFMQLHALGIIPWGLRETSSVVLIVAGVLILLQSQRRSERADQGPPGGVS